MYKYTFKKMIACSIIIFFMVPSFNVEAKDISRNIKTTFINSVVEVADKYEILKGEGVNDEGILILKTDASYEIALAYSDGSYYYADKGNNLEEAIKIANELRNPNDNETVIPTVINKYGQTIYSTNSVGRAVKYFNGREDKTDRNITLLYPDSKMTEDGFDTYINHKYAEDVPIIDDNGKQAKIEIAAYKGWINKDSSQKEYDLTIVPINQVTNSSCYYVKNGMLNHFISKNIKGIYKKTTDAGDTIIDCQKKYGVNALLILATAIHESGFGQSDNAKKLNNLFGINAIDSDPSKADKFNTPADSVIAYSQTYISKYYLDQCNFRYNGTSPGNKAMGKNVRYAGDPSWGEKVAKQAYRIDYYLSGNNIESLKDYNGYKIAMYTGINSIKDSQNETLYDIGNKKTVATGYVGNLVALLSGEIKIIDNINNGQPVYEIFPDRNTKVSNGKYEAIYGVGLGGEYDLNTRAYISTSNLKFINTTKDEFIPGYEKEDTNKNGEINIEDLSKVAIDYNIESNYKDFKKYLDLNSDKIIDIYDMISIARKCS